MILYHATTPKKFARYVSTGCIFPPVRGWSTLTAARNWARLKQRTVILRIKVAEAFPLPDHRRPDGRAYWSPELIDKAETP